MDEHVRDDGQRQALRGRVPGLDALRAVAVVAVLAYHLAVPDTAGGFLGVTLFFVISGYLITRLLLVEAQDQGTLHLPRFWMRRIRRLLPAAYTVILASLVLVMVVRPASLDRTREDAVAGLTYASNWWMVFHRIPYFETFDVPSPLNHLWSLAVEEQFYLVWPILLGFLLALVRRRGRILTLVGLGIVGSFTIMALTFNPADPNRSYVGTDTRMGELLIGAALALALHLHGGQNPLRAGTSAEGVLRSRWVAWLLLTSSAALWLWLATTLSDQGPFAYRGGILLAAVASAGLVLAVQSPSLAGGATWLDSGPVGAVGRRSYSIYLWHFPILVLLCTPTTYGVFSWTRSLVVVAATFACAEVSYRFIEQPIRRHGFRAVGTQAWDAVRRLPVPQRSVVAGSAFAVAVLPALAMAGVNATPPPDLGPSTITVGAAPSATQAPPPRAIVGKGVGRPKPVNHPTEPVHHVEKPLHHVKKSVHHAGQSVPQPSTSLRSMGPNTVAIGDSLMIDIAHTLTSKLPGISINAQVGRQPWTGLDIASTYNQFNRPGGIYLLGIGTNGAINADELAAFCRTHQSARILLITPRVNRPWEGTSVSSIRAAAAQFPNVQIVDFHDAAQGHPGWFASDGVHLTTSGINAMVSLIVAALRGPP